MWTNTTLLRQFSRSSKSPQLLTTSRHAKFQPCSTEDQNGGYDIGNTCSSNYRSWMVAGNGSATATPSLYVSINTVGLLWIVSDVVVNSNSKMAAITRKYICNVLSLSSYKRHQRISNGYTHNFEVQQYNWTSANTLWHRGYWWIKDGRMRWYKSDWPIYTKTTESV